MQTLIPPRQPCGMCSGGSTATFAGQPIGRCWICSGRGYTRDWDRHLLAALHGASLIVAALLGAGAAAALNCDLDQAAATLTAVIR
ncbi:hypothetical protein [Planomonospora algeriensis]